MKGLLKEQLQGLKEAEATLLDTMEKYVRSDKEIQQDYENLLTIKGIGRISALCLLVFFRTYLPGYLQIRDYRPGGARSNKNRIRNICKREEKNQQKREQYHTKDTIFSGIKLYSA